MAKRVRDDPLAGVTDTRRAPDGAALDAAGIPAIAKTAINAATLHLIAVASLPGIRRPGQVDTFTGSQGD